MSFARPVKSVVIAVPYPVGMCHPKAIPTQKQVLGHIACNWDTVNFRLGVHYINYHVHKFNQ